MGHFCDGRASLVVGTHTHAPTADHQVLPGGTAFISDVGMTGDYDSVIGMDKDEPLNRFLRKIPISRFEPALGAATLCARRGRDRRRDRPGAARRRRCGSADGWKQATAGVLGVTLFPRATASYNARASNAAAQTMSGRGHGRSFPIQEHHAPQGAPG